MSGGEGPEPGAVGCLWPTLLSKGRLSPQPKGLLPSPSAECVLGRLVCSKGKQAQGGLCAPGWLAREGVLRCLRTLCSQLKLITTPASLMGDRSSPVQGLSLLPLPFFDIPSVNRSAFP